MLFSDKGYLRYTVHLQVAELYNYTVIILMTHLLTRVHEKGHLSHNRNTSESETQ